jgi:periplasmic divalent cation tolerance protein
VEEYLQVITTTEKKENAEKIAKMLVKNRFAGCVQIIGPVSSVYWWKGKVEMTEEWLCLIKSEKRLFGKLVETIKEVHPYETPEIVAVPVVAGSRDYLEWLEEKAAGKNQTPNTKNDSNIFVYSPFCG